MRKAAAAFALLGGLGLCLPARPAAAQLSVSVNISIGGFYDELTPYGDWIDCRYGACWVPRGVEVGWQPYSNGEWIYTRYGWTWVSSDPWGADPYHYGTWDFVDRYGWVWVPGTVWAPAWVTWSYSNSYVGWAPMPPTVTFGHSGYSGSPIVVSQTRYVFVPTNQFVGTNVLSVRVEPRRNAEIYRQATHVTRFEVSGDVVRNDAIPLATVQQATSRRIETREISSARTTPRTMSSSGFTGSKRVAIVAPPSDVKAAHASRQKGAPQAAKPKPQQQEKPKHEAKPQQQPRPQQQDARPQQQEKSKHEAKPQQQPRPQQQDARPQQQQKKKPAGNEHGNSESKEKKDKPDGGGPPK